MLMAYRDLFTSSVKYSLNQRLDIHQFKKVLHGILITSRKLRHYFDEYKISVITDIPLADILHIRDATGRISKWTVELGALEINFKPRIAIKSQALVDFLAEWRENQIPAPHNILEHWIMYFDGSLKVM